jgi:hypothetical protein
MPVGTAMMANPVNMMTDAIIFPGTVMGERSP